MIQTAKFAGSIACVVAGASLLASAAFAQQDVEQKTPEIEYGNSLICQTEQQAAQLVAHLDSSMHAALNDDDAEVTVPPPCQAATVAFVRGQMLGTLRTKDAAFQMVRVLVVGVGAPNEFRSVAPAAFISLIKVVEYDV